MFYFVLIQLLGCQSVINTWLIDWLIDCTIARQPKWHLSPACNRNQISVIIQPIATKFGVHIHYSNSQFLIFPRSFALCNSKTPVESLFTTWLSSHGHTQHVQKNWWSLVTVWTCGFWDMLTACQADLQMETLITTVCLSATGDEATNEIRIWTPLHAHQHDSLLKRTLHGTSS